MALRAGEQFGHLIDAQHLPAPPICYKTGHVILLSNDLDAATPFEIVNDVPQVQGEEKVIV